MKILMLLSLVMAPGLALAANCKYDLDPKTVAVSWTAFKTTAKTPVGGSFPAVKLESKVKTKKSLKDALVGLKATIALSDEKALTTGNPGRDKTLFDHFFSKFKDAKITGKVTSTELKSDTEGAMGLEIKMNGKTGLVPMTVKYDEATGAFSAVGSVHILAFALEGAFEDLHKTCEDLHKGADGVSKTWDEADLKIEAKIARNCSK